MNIKQEFKQSIKCGTGKAYLILQENPNIYFSKYIKKAALGNYAYDAQSEGNRASYIAQLINKSNKKKQLINDVLKALATEQKNTWNLEQLFELAYIFAKQT